MARRSMIAKDCVKTIYKFRGSIILSAPLDVHFRLFLVHKEEDIAMLADSKVANQMDLWHIRLGHANERAIRQLVKATEGVDIPVNQKLSFCDTCQVSKATARPFFCEGKKELYPMEEITVDTTEQARTPAGYRFSLDMTCVGSTFGWTFKMKKKSEAPIVLRNFVESADRSIHSLGSIRFLTSDHGGEFLSSEFSNYLKSKGIFHKTGPARTPNYNEQERHNRTLGEKQRALLKDANLPDIFGLSQETLLST
jgi:hypothetical protein